jgi:S1-C subfamily serine protease
VALRDPGDPRKADDVAGLKRAAAYLDESEFASARADVEQFAPQPAGRRAARSRSTAVAAEHGMVATGSGFYVSRDGYILTNRHVVNAATFRGAEALKPGESVVAVGFPLAGLLASDPIVTNGIVNALAGPGNDPRLIQISAPIQPGNSGGPVFDAAGRVVGIAVATLNAVHIAAATGAVPENVNFAVKAEVARRFLDEHGIAVTTQATAKEQATTAIAQRAAAFTIRPECWK